MMNNIIFAFGLLLSLFSPYVTSDPDAASKNTTRVIIVGAGASGIAAASRLFENGFTNVLVLEAEDRIGGRVYTMDFPGESSVIEIGGQWVHGEKDNVVYELAGPRNLLKSSVVTYLRPIFMQSSAQSIDDKLSNGVMDLFDVIRGEEIDEKIFKSTGDYFVTSVNAAWKNSSLNITEDLKEQFLEWLHQAMNGYDCSDTWFESAATSSYWECEGDHNLAWKENGYRTIFSILTEKSNSILGKSFIDNYIIKNTEVVKITPDNNGVRVKCDNGKEYEADHVIVTVSLGVLKATYSNLFPPKVLPEQKVKAIEYLLIGSVAKLYFKFPHQWWPENISGLGLLWTKEDKEEYKKQGLKWVTDVYHFYAVDNNPTMLCGWVAGQSARDMEKTDKEVVKTQLIQVLKKFFDKKYKIPEPIWFYRTTWKSNPHFRGAYSFVGTISEQMNVSAADLLEPVVNGDKKPIILFAGEATNPHHYSTVHGAIETGRREADRIISLKELPK